MYSSCAALLQLSTVLHACALSARLDRRAGRRHSRSSPPPAEQTRRRHPRSTLARTQAAAPPPEAAGAASDEAPRCSKRQRGEALPFAQQYDDVLEVGPLSKGLMTFGGRMPHNVYNKLRALYAEKFKQENRALYDEVGGREFAAKARRHFSEHCTLKVKS